MSELKTSNNCTLEVRAVVRELQGSSFTDIRALAALLRQCCDTIDEQVETLDAKNEHS